MKNGNVFHGRISFIIILSIVMYVTGICQIIPAGHPRIYLNDSIRTRLTTALTGNRQTAVRFRDMVNNQLAGGNVYSFFGWHSALLYQLTGDKTYGTYAVNFIDSVVISEEALINTGQSADVAFDSYLYVGDIIGDLALVYDWCYDLLTENQKTRWLAYANQAVWNVWNSDSARWGGVSHSWDGWSTNDPMDNYYYSFLRATMMLGLAEYNDDARGSEWITMFRQTKIAGQLIPMFASGLNGGGSLEGTGYGVSHRGLFELYDFWEQTTGERIHDLTSHARQSLLYYLYMIVPTLDWIAPIGDQARESSGALFDYHREYIEVLSFLYRNDPIARYGKWYLNHCSVPEMTHGFEYVYDFIYDNPSTIEMPLNDLGLLYYAQGVGQIFTRSSWETDATWINLIAGPYIESHAHRDQGSFMIYHKEWLADDQNRRTHSGIRQEEILHNLVRIDNQSGVTTEMDLGASSNFVARRDTREYTYVGMNVTPMYNGSSTVSRVEREMVFIRPNVIIIFDRVDGTANTTRVWQLNTPILPSINSSTATITGTQSKLTISRVLPVNAPLSITDWSNIGDADMDNGGYRLNVTDSGGNGTSRFFHVLSLDNAVISITPDDVGTRRGVNISLAGGGSAIVQFENDTWGGYLQIHDSLGNISADTSLTTNINEHPPLRGDVPSDYCLNQNFPNPFNPSTTISFSVGTYGYTSLKIYDILGREIKTLVNEVKSPGTYNIRWDGKNSAGQQVASGVYFYQLSVVPSGRQDLIPTESRNGKSGSGFIETKKLILAK